MALAAALLAWGMYWIDTGIPNEALDTSHLVLSGTPSEMRTGLLAMATTVLATAGVVFTLLTLPCRPLLPDMVRVCCASS